MLESRMFTHRPGLDIPYSLFVLNFGWMKEAHRCRRGPVFRQRRGRRRWLYIDVDSCGLS